MGFRFRKSFKLAPGVRMNLSGSGLGWTLGPRGASIGIGKDLSFKTFEQIGISPRFLPDRTILFQVALNF
jgi:hypothetical protein